MARTIYDLKFDRCACGALICYDFRAGRMPKSCEKKACRSKAQKQGRKKREPTENFEGDHVFNTSI